MHSTLLMTAFAACLAFAAQSAASGGARRQVILTTDCGTEMDDQWALAQLALSTRRLDLLGVVTTHAPNIAAPAAEATARWASEVLDHLPLRKRPPVMPGSSVPLPDAHTPLMNDGVRFILDKARSHTPQDRLAVLAIGAVTDVASAVLAQPDVADRIEVVAMGFYDWATGGAEWNVHNDPAGWQALLASRAPIVAGDHAVCKQDLLMDDVRGREIFSGCGPAGDYILNVLIEHVTRHPEGVKGMTGLDHTWPVWDSVTVAYLLGMAETHDRPRPALGDDCIFRHGSAGSVRRIRWITHVHSERLWADFARKLRASAR